MRRLALIWTVLMVLAVAPLSALAVNAASAEARWPGPLDNVRSHPWAWLLGLAVLAACATVVDRWLSPPPEVAPPPAERGVDLRGSSIGTLNLQQGDSTTQALANGDQPLALSNTSAFPQADADVWPTPSSPPAPRACYILYSMSPFLGDGRWEEGILDCAKQAGDAAMVLPIDPPCVDAQDVAAVVVVFASAHHHLVKRDVAATLRLAQSQYGSAKVLLIAAGLADAPLTQEEGHRWLRNCSGHSRYLECPTIGVYDQLLTSNLRVAIEIHANQYLASRRRQVGQSEEEGDGDATSDAR